MKKHELKLGDVVQISPDAPCALPGCFAQVERTESWGVVAWVGFPGPVEGATVVVGFATPPCRAYVRLAWEHIEYVGQAPFVGGP